MIKRISSFLFSLFLLKASVLFGGIIECNSLTEMLPYIEEETFVFYEVDEILLQGTTVVSQVPFFNELKDELLQEGYCSEQIANKLYPLWVKVHKLAEVVPFGEDVFTFIETLNQKKIPAFALTHRGPRLVSKTLDQLNAHGISFNLPDCYLCNTVFEDGLVLFLEGMLFVHPICSKGNALLNFFDFMGIKPKKVVAIDSQLIDLVGISQTLGMRGIEFLGIYLNKDTRKLSELDLQVGKLQLEYLEKILPDDLAFHIANISEG